MGNLPRRRIAGYGVYYSTKWASQLAQWIKNLPANVGDIRDVGLIPGSGKSLREGNATTLLPGESHGQRSLRGYSPWGRKELDTTEAT